MVGKRKRIRDTIRNAQKHGKHINPKELASCTGKIRHSSYEAAKEFNKEKGDAVKAYKCNFCPFYHVGRAPKKKA